MAGAIGNKLPTKLKLKLKLSLAIYGSRKIDIILIQMPILNCVVYALLFCATNAGVYPRTTKKWKKGINKK